MPSSRIERLETARIALIMAHALEEFSLHRYSDASFNRIIKATKMAKGTMYYYFQSKEDLFLTLYKASIRDFHKLKSEAERLLGLRDHFWEQTERLLHALCYLLRMRPQSGAFVLNFLVGGHLQDEHPARESALQLEQWLRQWLEKGQREGAVRRDLSPELACSLAFGVWQALLPSGPIKPEQVPAYPLIFDLVKRLVEQPAEKAEWDDDPFLAGTSLPQSLLSTVDRDELAE